MHWVGLGNKTLACGPDSCDQSESRAPACMQYTMFIESDDFQCVLLQELIVELIFLYTRISFLFCWQGMPAVTFICEVLPALNTNHLHGILSMQRVFIDCLVSLFIK